jgi:hypothetical protein
MDKGERERENKKKDKKKVTKIHIKKRMKKDLLPFDFYASQDATSQLFHIGNMDDETRRFEDLPRFCGIRTYLTGHEENKIIDLKHPSKRDQKRRNEEQGGGEKKREKKKRSKIYLFIFFYR